MTRRPQLVRVPGDRFEKAAYVLRGFQPRTREYLGQVIDVEASPALKFVKVGDIEADRPVQPKEIRPHTRNVRDDRIRCPKQLVKRDACPVEVPWLQYGEAHGVVVVRI